MSDTPRFTIIDGQEYPDPDGQWVFINDAVAAAAAAREEERQRINSMLVVDYVREQYERGAADKAAELQDYYGEQAHGHYMDGYNAGVKAARDAVAALPAYYAIEECQGNPLEKGDPEDPDPWKQGHLIERDDALAAIDALLKEKP